MTIQVSNVAVAVAVVFRPVALMILVFSIFLSTTPLKGEARTNHKLSMGERISREPFSFRELLGLRLDDVVSELGLDKALTWDSFFVAEEYNDKEVRYQAWGIRDYVRAWGSLGNDVCISPKSMLLLFFNRGYLFKVEFRFLSTKVYGGTPPCEDHAPVVDFLAKRIDGVLEKGSDGQKTITKVDGDVVELVGTDGGSASLIWFVRSSPEKLR